MDPKDKKKKKLTAKADSAIEEAVKNGLQADHPFQTEARYNGETDSSIQALQKANADLAEKETQQTFRNS
ncbi:hypothetical protein [Bacillus piscicola]|uniref:hypothetical protein n=1 Tax=Bacillus piscicola TaxID=1632684 RepID=UPI001F094970|nr:hypothetical protein [Bacillus piscicola]